MRGYIVVRSLGSEIGRYEVDTRKPIADELIRVIKEEQLVFSEGDIVTFESE